jgi:hypothetical protein
LNPGLHTFKNGKSILLWLFADEVSQIVCPGWLQTVILLWVLVVVVAVLGFELKASCLLAGALPAIFLISVFQVDRIIGMSSKCPVHFSDYSFLTHCFQLPKGSTT